MDVHMFLFATTTFLLIIQKDESTKYVLSSFTTFVDVSLLVTSSPSGVPSKESLALEVIQALL